LQELFGPSAAIKGFLKEKPISSVVERTAFTGKGIGAFKAIGEIR
jgi:hypothetical protein